MEQKLLSIREMAVKSGLTTGSLRCYRNRGKLNLDWRVMDRAVFATEASFNDWMKRRAALKKAVDAFKGGN
jgi:hypothetical protein